LLSAGWRAVTRTSCVPDASDSGGEGRTAGADGSYAAYIHITGVDALAAELRARGAEILDEPEDRVYGQRELVIRDCNGLVLAFGERTTS